MGEQGHNGGPPLVTRNFKRRWAEALFAHPQKPTGAVALGFKLYMEMDSTGRGAVISDKEFAQCCGVSERACQNFKRWLIVEEFVHIHVKGVRGRSNEFIANIPNAELAAPDAVINSDDRHPLPANTTGLPAPNAVNHVPPAPDAGNPSRVPDARNESPSGIVIFKNNNLSPQTPQTFEDPYQRVVLENGGVTLVNGLRQYWLERFEGDEISLDLALIEIAGNLQVNSRQPLESQVSSKLARMVRSRLDSDKRYDKAVKRREPARKASDLYSAEAIEKELLKIQAEGKR